MKKIIISNIVLAMTLLPAFAQNDLNLLINLESIEKVELQSGEVIDVQDLNLKPHLIIKDENLVIEKETSIKKIELRNGGSIRLGGPPPSASYNGGDMGGGGR